MSNFVIGVRVNLYGNHNHLTTGVARGSGPMGPPNEMLLMIKMMTQSLLFTQFQFLLAFFECNSTRVLLQQLAITLILTTKEPVPLHFKALPTNLNVQDGRNSVFLL